MSLYDSLSPGAKDLYNRVANIFGARNIVLTSTRRKPLFGNQNSQHNTGDAFDFRVKGYTNERVVQILANSGLDFRQLINEVSGPKMTGPHIHIGAGKGNQVAQIVNGRFQVINPKAPNRESVLAGLGGTINEAVDSVVKPVTDAINDPVGTAFGVISSELVSRIVAVVLGIILIGLAIAAFNFSGRVSNAASALVKG
jgi:hypothetical protein